MSSVQAKACGTAALRAVNLLFGAACIPLFYFVHRQLHADSTTYTSLAAVRCYLVCFALAQMHALLLPL